MEPELERPQWPYAIGTLGAVFVGLGALWMVLSMGSRQGGGSAPLWLLGIGATALGVAWIATFRFGHAGAGGVLGSFLLPLVFVYLAKSHEDSWIVARAQAQLLFIAFTAFAAGHIFVRGLGWVRACAAISTFGFAVMLVADIAKWRLEADSIKALVVIAFGGLAATGVALAIGFQKLYTQRRDEHAL